MNILDLIKSILGNGKKNARFITKTLVKTYGDPDALEVGLYDKNTPIANEEIGIEINTRKYIKTTNENGIATLNINLGVGAYTAKLYYPGNKEYNNVTGYAEVFVKGNTYMEGTDVNKTFGDDTKYQTALYDSITGERIRDEVIIFINGKEYKKTANDEGLYELAINLGVGTYTITSAFNGNDIYNSSSVTNTIVVKESGGNPKIKDVILGCDANTSNDYNFQSRLGEILENEGYNVELLPIGPNYFAQADYSSYSSGKIGIYLIASGIFSIADAAYGSGQFSQYVFGIRGDFGDKGATDFNTPISADLDCTSICDKLDGKTFNEINAMLQPYVSVCGGADVEELGRNIIQWLKDSNTEQEAPQEPEHGGASTELHEYFTETAPGYLGQHTSYTCGPHSLMQCIHRLTGEDVSEMTLASVCGTTSEGTDHEGLETGLAWFNREYGYNLKMEWKNFSEVGFDGTQQAIDNGACFHHILYRDRYGHYEVPKWTDGDPIYVLNSLGDYCGSGYCGYVEERSRSEHQSYINGISQKSVCIITRGE